MALVVKNKYKNTGYGTTFGGPTLGALLEGGNDMIPLTFGGVMIITGTDDGAEVVD